MRFRPPAHLAWCITAGQVVFLDIRRDRYSQLGPELVAPFRLAIAGELPSDGPEADAVARMAAQGLLVAVMDGEPALSSPPIARPRASLLEAPGEGVRHRAFRMGPRTFASVLATREKMRRVTFERLIADAAACKPVDRESCEIGAERANTVALAFARWRRFVPIKPVCLLDSLALVDCLSKDGLRVDLVFGVALRPFTAHCWVQSQDLVLNDNLDRVLAHTPILVV
jgi:hypothetical protein